MRHKRFVVAAVLIAIAVLSVLVLQPAHVTPNNHMHITIIQPAKGNK